MADRHERDYPRRGRSYEQERWRRDRDESDDEERYGRGYERGHVRGTSDFDRSYRGEGQYPRYAAIYDEPYGSRSYYGGLRGSEYGTSWRGGGRYESEHPLSSPYAGMGEQRWGEERDWDEGGWGARGWVREHPERERGSRMLRKVKRFFGIGPKGYTRSDERIREDVSDLLWEDNDVDASNIELRVQGGEVTLTGSVEERWQKRRAEDLAESVRGVKDVHNQIRIVPKTELVGETRAGAPTIGNGDRNRAF